ncbi:MAG: sensor histidine kinase [bacterium]
MASHNKLSNTSQEEIHVVGNFSEEDVDKLLQLNENLQKTLTSTAKKLKATEAQLAQAGKLAALGTLGAEVAHELNNPLTVVSSEADEILDAIEDGYFDEKFVATSAANIKQHAERMRAIIDHIRRYSRDENDSPWVKLNINEVVHNSLILLRSQLDTSGIRIDLRLKENLPDMWGHANKLESIFVNIISNAADAFDSIGRDRNKKLSIASDLENGKRIKVCIADNAGGIPEHVRANIFKAFFTTKAPGKGTGLGLAIVQNLVKEHRGVISVESREGQGSKFIIKFPLERRNRKELSH